VPGGLYRDRNAVRAGQSHRVDDVRDGLGQHHRGWVLVYQQVPGGAAQVVSPVAGPKHPTGPGVGEPVESPVERVTDGSPGRG
jgi:hypothetical protein